MASRQTALVGKLSISGKEAKAELDAVKRKMDDLARGFTKPIAIKLRPEFEGPARQAYQKPAVEMLKTQQAVLSMNGRMVTSNAALGSSSRNAGLGVLALSEAFEDAQYGLRGILNNIPQAVLGFGGTAGLAGALSFAAVGLSIVSSHLDLTGDAIAKNEQRLADLTLAWKKETEAAADAASQAAGERVAREQAATEAQAVIEAHERSADAIDKEAAARHADADATLRQVAARKAMRESNVAIFGFGLNSDRTPPGSAIGTQRGIDRDAEKDTFRAHQESATADEAANKARADLALKEAAEIKKKINTLRVSTADLRDDERIRQLETDIKTNDEKLKEARDLYEKYRPDGEANPAPSAASLLGGPVGAMVSMAGNSGKAGTNQALSAFYAKQMERLQSQITAAGAEIQGHNAAKKASPFQTLESAQAGIQSKEAEAREKEREAQLLNEKVAASRKARGVGADVFGTEQAAKDAEAEAHAKHENALRIIEIVVQAGERTLTDLKSAANRVLERSRQILQNIHSDQDLAISEVKNPRRRKRLERARDLQRRTLEIKKDRPGIGDLEAAGIAEREQEVRDHAAGDRTIHGAGPARNSGGLDEYNRFRDKNLPLGGKPDTSNEAKGRAAVEKAIDDVKKSGAGDAGKQIVATLKDILSAIRNNEPGPADRNQPVRK